MVDKNVIRLTNQYLQSGFSIVLVSDDKTPLHSWRHYQSVSMTMQELESVVEKRKAHGVAIVGGKVSRNFAVCDIDCKNDLSKKLIKDFFRELNERSDSLLRKLTIATTPSGGFHFYFFTEQEIESSVIARNMFSENNCSVLIEIRSKCLYTIVPPSPGYRFIQGDLRTLPVLNAEEIDVLFSAGAACNRCVNVIVNNKKNAVPKQDRIGSPLDDFDERGDIVELLLKHGWKICPSRIDKNLILFQRPGITQHRISANFHKLYNAFIVHSSSTQFLPGIPYRPSAVFAELECLGNYSFAAKKLLAMGFGIPYAVQRRLGMRS